MRRGRLHKGLSVVLILLPGWAIAEPGPSSPITVRTEIFARPPYSGATYYIYERDHHVICTKLAVCNKYNECDTSYTKGAFKDSDDASSSPFSSTAPVVIPERALARHICLTRFDLLGNARPMP